MNREEVRKLLGGYATGTLTPEEQQALMAAALEDQELFDALAKEQPVRELLRDPAAKAELLAALDGGGERRSWWRWRPVLAAVAMAGVAAVAVFVWRSPQEPKRPVMVAEMKPPEPPALVAIPAAPPPVTKRKTAVKPPEKTAEPGPAATNLAAVADQVKVAHGALAEQAQSTVPTQQSAPAPIFSQQQQQFRAAPVRPAKSEATAPYRILRGDQEAPAATVLDSGETVRLRILPPADGALSLMEGDRVLVSARVEKGKAFDTSPLPFEGSGMRELRMVVGGFATTIRLQYR